MGRSLSADLAYGVNLGYSDDGWNFDGYADPCQLLGMDEGEMGRDWAETALLMFLGRSYDEAVNMGYGDAQAALRKCPLEIDVGGYEYGRLLLCIRSSSVHGIFSVQSIDLPEPPSVEEANVLVAFLKWLEEKGLVLEAEHRNPGWILAASYG